MKENEFRAHMKFLADYQPFDCQKYWQRSWLGTPIPPRSHNWFNEPLSDVQVPCYTLEFVRCSGGFSRRLNYTRLVRARYQAQRQEWLSTMRRAYGASFDPVSRSVSWWLYGGACVLAIALGGLLLGFVVLMLLISKAGKPIQ